ncbi:MAG TPA: NAD(P)/FAD-dependent oxidoreductase [Alphaproteobacteria bacterium]|nr:NAD(P)/FAD-dependent oxidoreductase [Alphaproteobacteria bacterium]HAJ47329.1 NAD(P)/FAD-dependent oxidoreductase [Alphaproteobacteria bacterium]
MPDHMWDAIIIGSGLGGLAAAAKLATAGRRVLVLERNAYAGGAACTYRHAGLQIEASLHEINGVTPGDPKMRALSAMGVLDHVRFSPVPEFAEVRSTMAGAPLRLPHGFTPYREALTMRFPHKADGIDAYMDMLEGLHSALTQLSGTHGPLWWMWHGAEALGGLGPLLTHARDSVSEAFEHYFGAEEGLKAVAGAHMEYFHDDPSELWFALFAAVTASYIADGGYYVYGGSGALARAFVHVIEDHGGAVLTGHTVTRILAGDAGVSGVVHLDEDHLPCTEHSRVVLGNAAPAAIGPMLPAEMQFDFAAAYRDKPLSSSLFTITYGLKTAASSFGIRAYSTVVYPDGMRRFDEVAAGARLLAQPPGQALPKYILTDASQIDSGLKHSKGRHVLNVTGADRLGNWAGLDEPSYCLRKAAWIGAILADLDRRWPGLAASVDWHEMATARAMAHFLNTPEGAVYGFAPRPPAPFPDRPRITTSVPGLYLASAYTVSGGYTGAIIGGLMAADRVLEA